MSNIEYIDKNLVDTFFKMLNAADINYVLLKNMGHELPERLKNGKDIDVLVNLEDRKRFTETMLENGFLHRIPPLGRENGYRFAYQLPEYQFWQLGGIEQIFYIDACFKLMCKSLTPKYWVPLDESINRAIWENKCWDENLKCWAMDDKTLVVYLLARAVFDKKNFSDVYIQEIEQRKYLLEDKQVYDMLRTVFYKYTDTLINLLRKSEYTKIVNSYITFKEY